MVVERVEKQPMDFLLFLILLMLVGVGMAMVLSASAYEGQRTFADPYYFLKRQLLSAGVGLALTLALARLPHELLRRLSPALLLIALMLTLLTFVPGLGRPVLGARRWLLVFGLSFQPSELVKLAVVLYLASVFHKKEGRMDDPVNSILPPLIVVAAFVALIYVQNDFSTAFFVLLVALSVFFMAQVRLYYFLLLAVLVVPLGGMLLFTRAHRVQRLMAFLNPLADPEGSGFQIIAARAALVSGGFWGKGLGRGLRKLGGLPEVHSDFIFAAVGEEAGFLGALFVILLFVVLAWRGYRIAAASEDSFVRLLAFGITSTLVLQALLNVAVVLGLAPATGIPLPFFSAGGSSLMISMVMGGVLLNLSRGLSPAFRSRQRHPLGDPVVDSWRRHV